MHFVWRMSFVQWLEAWFYKFTFLFYVAKKLSKKFSKTKKCDRVTSAICVLVPSCSFLRKILAEQVPISGPRLKCSDLRTGTGQAAGMRMVSSGLSLMRKTIDWDNAGILMEPVDWNRFYRVKYRSKPQYFKSK